MTGAWIGAAPASSPYERERSAHRAILLDGGSSNVLMLVVGSHGSIDRHRGASILLFVGHVSCWLRMKEE